MARTAVAKNVEGEEDRATVNANGIVVDVIAQEDGSVYVECYAYDGRKHQAIVQIAHTDRYQTRHPNLQLTLADREVTHE